MKAGVFLRGVYLRAHLVLSDINLFVLDSAADNDESLLVWLGWFWVYIAVFELFDLDGLFADGPLVVFFEYDFLLDRLADLPCK